MCFFFKIKFIGVTLVNKIILVSNTHFCGTWSVYVLCACHPKSDHLPPPWIWPPLPFTDSPSPFGYCCLCVSVLCPIYEWNHMVLSFFWLTSLGMLFSRFIHVVASGSVSSLLAECVPLCIRATSFWSSPLSKDRAVVSTSPPRWMMLHWARVAYILAKKWFQVFWVDTQKKDCWVIW